MKQVIFIGGTSYSGTTLLELTLGNDKHGFSCGEVRDYFHPTERHHFNNLCSCGDKNCSLWDKIKFNGEVNLYETIFNIYPEVKFITDSSKDPFWIEKQCKNLESKGIKTTNILIWKSPEEIAASYYKRGRLEEWHIRWIRYHRLYCTLINNWRSVKCSDFINNSLALEKICNYADIPYFPEKREYRELKSHMLFGNTSAKIELYSEESDTRKKMRNELEFKNDGMKTLENDLGKVNEHIKKIKNKNNFVKEIEEILESRDIFNNAVNFKSEVNIRMSLFEKSWRVLKRRMRLGIGKIKYKALAKHSF